MQQCVKICVYVYLKAWQCGAVQKSHIQEKKLFFSCWWTKAVCCTGLWGTETALVQTMSLWFSWCWLCIMRDGRYAASYDPLSSTHHTVELQYHACNAGSQCAFHHTLTVVGYSTLTTVTVYPPALPVRWHIPFGEEHDQCLPVKKSKIH